MEIQDFDKHALQSLMKIGGKKKIDALIQMMKDSGPARLQELKETNELAEAKAAAQALKSSAIHLGLNGVEAACDQILEAKSWSAQAALALQAEAAFKRGWSALQTERAKI